MANFTTPELVGFGMDLSDNESDDSAAADGNRPQRGGRKRLSEHKVYCLEKSFNVDNKLEPRRRNQLAKELGLQPKQVAIWFQNRRARNKNKQIENDYDKVAGQYGMIKAQYDKVINENKKLKAEMKSMKEQMSLMKDSLLNYGRLMKAGLLAPQIMQNQSQTQPIRAHAQAVPQFMHRTQPELHKAYNNNKNEFEKVSSKGRMIEQQVQVKDQHQQKVVSPASSVFDSNSPVFTAKYRQLAPGDIYYPVVEKPAEKRNANFMQVEQENSVNQELPNHLPNLSDFDDQNCFYSSKVVGPPATPCDFGVIPAADDPIWQFIL
ncbi:unnamed protein product [Rhodiola kirilowii]